MGDVMGFSARTTEGKVVWFAAAHDLYVSWVLLPTGAVEFRPVFFYPYYRGNKVFGPLGKDESEEVAATAIAATWRGGSQVREALAKAGLLGMDAKWVAERFTLLQFPYWGDRYHVAFHSGSSPEILTLLGAHKALVDACVTCELGVDKEILAQSLAAMYGVKLVAIEQAQDRPKGLAFTRMRARDAQVLGLCGYAPK